MNSANLKLTSFLIANSNSHGRTSGKLTIDKRRNRIKLLRFEGDGYAIFYKRLEKGTFEMPAYDSQNHTMVVSDSELTFILKGVALKKVKYRVRYTHPGASC